MRRADAPSGCAERMRRADAPSGCAERMRRADAPSGCAELGAEKPIGARSRRLLIVAGHAKRATVAHV